MDDAFDTRESAEDRTGVRPHNQKRPADGKCTYPGCEREWHSKGYCSMHLHRLKKGLDMDGAIEGLSARVQCSVANCTRRAVKKGLCDAHYQRTRKGTELEAPIGPPFQPLPSRPTGGSYQSWPAAERKRRREKQPLGLLLVYRWDRRNGVFVLEKERQVTRQQVGKLPKHRIVVYLDHVQFAPVVRSDNLELMGRFDVGIAAERLERWRANVRAA